MSEVTVASMAKVLGMPTEKLLEQLAGAGMTFSGPDQVVSSTEKMKLLGFLRRTHGKDEKPTEVSTPKKITLQRRKQEELTVNAGKTKSTVTVEVRQKRTYVKRDDVDAPVTDERQDALRKLEGKKDMAAHLHQIHELEHKADGLSRAAIGRLFRDGSDPLEVIKLRDLYTVVEETIDAAEDAAEVIERILAKS